MSQQKELGIRLGEALAHRIESLFTSRDFAGVIECYEANRSLLAESGNALAASVLRQVSRAQASLSDYSSALKTARTAQAVASEDGDSPLLAEICLTIGNTLRSMGELKEAERSFRDAESIFRRNDCHEGQSRALNLLAGLFFRRNDYKRSLEVLLDAAEIARRLDDLEKLAYMMGNIGRLYTFVGEFAKAEKHLRINIDMSTELGDELEVARAWLSLGYVRIQRADYPAARTALAEAKGRLDRLASRHDNLTYLTYLGELEYRGGHPVQAIEILNEALAMAREVTPGTAAEGRVLRHLAEAYVLRGETRSARKMAAGAMVIMKKAGDRVETGALHKVMGQVAAAEGKTTGSCRAFEKAIEVLSDTEVLWEKAEALMAAANAGVFPPRQSLTCLFRAEEIYSRTGMAERSAEVTEAANRLSQPGSAGRVVSETTNPPEADRDYLTGCPEIDRFKKQLALLGDTDLPLLLTGETGVGKDHMARYYHGLVRPSGPYVSINCASVPENLLESELFGYRRGAFTGADTDKPGLFAVAHGGVLFLDEIGEMPPSLQAKLLGVLERRQLMPLGGIREIPLDFRLVAATNCDLEELVESGGFRRDLYYRLSGVVFNIPSLRDRKEDIPILLRKFASGCNLFAGSGPPPEVVRYFVAYDWPGNVRELENKVRRLEVMSRMVADGDLEEIVRTMFEQHRSNGSGSASLFERVEEFERRLITEALLAAGGNKCRAARMLGIHEATVRVKLKRYGIACPSKDTADRTVLVS
jgi:two-component system NtrC family response regulator